MLLVQSVQSSIKYPNARGALFVSQAIGFVGRKPLSENKGFLLARRSASAVLAVGLCLSVCLSVTSLSR